MTPYESEDKHKILTDVICMATLSNRQPLREDHRYADKTKKASFDRQSRLIGPSVARHGVRCIAEVNSNTMTEDYHDINTNRVS